MKKITRRRMLGESLGVSAIGASAMGFGIPMLSESASGEEPERKLRIVVAGAHPDDPESGCGGTAALYTAAGHAVELLYLTRGEAGIPGKTAEQAAAIRSAESVKACEILKARPEFAGQIDGQAEVNPKRYDQFVKILDAEHPDIVFTHWPIDTHRDHRATSLLVYDAWLRSGKKFELYYFEVEQGAQSQLFHPTNYVDITATEPLKRKACFAHASQDPVGFYAQHERMHQFRGMECGCQLAEAFVRHTQNVPLQPPTRDRQ